MISARNEGFRVLAETVCSIETQRGPQGRIENEGFPSAGETLTTVDTSLVHDFEQRHPDSLVAMIEERGNSLAPGELCLIHEIALRRLASFESPEEVKAKALARLVMRVTAARLNSPG
jgi:hypothetical protein